MDRLNDTMQQEQHILDELRKRPVSLPPDDYFGQMKEQLFSQLEQPKAIPLYRRFSFLAVSAAASVMLIIGLFVFNERRPHDDAHPNVDWNTVSREDILAYVDENIEEFDAMALAKHLDTIPEWHSQADVLVTDSVLADLPSRSNHLEQLMDELDKEDILKYLQEEAIELDEEWLLDS